MFRIRMIRTSDSDPNPRNSVCRIRNPVIMQTRSGSQALSWPDPDHHLKWVRIENSLLAAGMTPSQVQPDHFAFRIREFQSSGTRSMILCRIPIPVRDGLVTRILKVFRIRMIRSSDSDPNPRNSACRICNPVILQTRSGSQALS